MLVPFYLHRLFFVSMNVLVTLIAPVQPRYQSFCYVLIKQFNLHLCRLCAFVILFVLLNFVSVTKP